MIKAVLFDLDGTLIFAEKAIIKGIQKCFMMHNLCQPEEEMIRGTIGLSMVEAFSVLQFPDPEKGANLYREFFLEQPEDISINPESFELLDISDARHCGGHFFDFNSVFNQEHSL